MAIEILEQGNPILQIYTSDPALTTASVRAHFSAERIPNTWLPREIVYMAELPVLRTGKVDYQTLQKMTSAS